MLLLADLFYDALLKSLDLSLLGFRPGNTKSNCEILFSFKSIRQYET